MSSIYLHFLKDKIQWRRPLAETLHNIQFVSGGLVVSENVSIKYKATWIIQHVFAPLTVISSNVAYSVIYPQQDIFAIAYIAQSTGTMISCLANEFATIFYHNNVSHIIKIIDRKFNEYETTEDGYDDEDEIIGFNHWIKALSSAYIRRGIELLPIVVGLLNSGITLWYDTSRMHHVSGYFYTFPNLHHINNAITYIGVTAWQIITYAPAIISGSLACLNVVLISLEIRKEFAVLKQDIDLHSEEFQRRMSAIYESESKLKKNPRNQITLRRRVCCNEFFAAFDEFIQRHRKLIRLVNSFKPYLEVFLTQYIMEMSLLMIPQGFLFLAVMDNSETSFLEIVVVFLTLFCCTLLLCFIGKLCRDMNDSMESAIYNMPWYELTPKQRKVAHLFLCQAQQTIKLKAFKIYPVTFQLMPRIMNFVYSQVVVLRTIRDKK